jgi:hypothetical protein
MSISFLTKLGQVALKGVQVAIGLAPMVSPFLPPSAQPIAQTVTNDLTTIGGIIGSVEAAGQALALPGVDKLKAATPLVAQAVISSSLMVGKKIADPELFNRGAKKMADGMADILNSIHGDSLHVEDKSS